MNKVLLIFGTRPELIKIAPIIREYEERGIREDLIVVHTGQHNSLVTQDLHAFDIKPDHALHCDRAGNDLNSLVGNMLIELNTLLRSLLSTHKRISCIISQGDTASTYCSSLLAFHAGIPFYHIEAGMRTYNLKDPFPEEFYRTSISHTADVHFPPTEVEYTNLINEGIDPSKIVVAGNTVIDNLKRHFAPRTMNKKKQALITLHRREMQEATRLEYIEYFENLAAKNADWQFFWLNHPGFELDEERFAKLDNITLAGAVSYAKMLDLYAETSLIYTDSGGVQEEAGYLGIPCMIAREKTERMQGIVKGVSAFLDTKELDVNQQLLQFDDDKLIHQNDLYGNGSSAVLIVNEVLKLALEVVEEIS